MPAIEKVCRVVRTANRSWISNLILHIVHVVHMMHQFRKEAKPMSLSTNEQRIVAARLQAAGIPVSLEDQSAIKPDLTIEFLKGSRFLISRWEANMCFMREFQIIPTET